MTKRSIFALLFASLAAAAVWAPPLRAQVDTHSPIAVKVIPQKPLWMKATVVRADGRTIIVSEIANPRILHTFTYSGKSLDAITRVLDEGGYQVGDKVKIKYMPGSTVALDLRGKPSKSP